LIRKKIEEPDTILTKRFDMHSILIKPRTDLFRWQFRVNPLERGAASVPRSGSDPSSEKGHTIMMKGKMRKNA
jgi:hypothetical protein